MVGENSPSDIFSFIQLRPRRKAENNGSISLDGSTPLAKEISGAPTPARRAEIANAALKQSKIKTSSDARHGRDILEATGAIAELKDPTTAELWEALPGLGEFQESDEFGRHRELLSDVLLASFFATKNIPEDLDGLQLVFRVYHLPNPEERKLPLAAFLQASLVAPELVRRDKGRTQAATARATSKAAGPGRAAIDSAISELVRLDRKDKLVQPNSAGLATRGTTAFALTADARKALSRDTAAVARAAGISLKTTPIETAVHMLAKEKVFLPVEAIKWPTPVVQTQTGTTLPPAPGPALVSPAGVADLLVVKQQIKRYEAAEIAHVENILAGEKKSRAHRRLERSEESFLSETETTRTQETELQTADRFELSREASETIKNDRKVGFDLSLSGKYGPTIEFSSSLSVEASTMEEQSEKSASRFAKDVVKRSLDRLTERQREVRTRTIIRETEETNLHEFTNSTAAHINGVYQFLDKIYETQIFNYGIRQMFDFMVPEPASFLWHVEKNPILDINLPPAPKELRQVCPDASYLTEDMALALAAEFGADIDPPPLPYLLLTTAFKHGQDDASESGVPRSNQQSDLNVPAGYRPVRARAQIAAITDDNPVMTLMVGTEQALWRPSSGDRINVSDGNQIAYRPTLYLTLGAEPFAMGSESKLSVALVAYETTSYVCEVAVVASRTAEAMDAWQLATFKKLRASHQERVREYEQKVAQLQAEAEARAERENRMPFGAPPSINRQTIATELKKHCISILTQQWYDAFDATKDGDPPTFDLAESVAEGAYIRFFEQAFEWDQLQWVFYPYFWARKRTWIERFVKQDIDPQFLEFWRAGSARVVAPVRPGFEDAISHFLETGKIWAGEGDPPKINTPLYVSIVDEIRERTGAPKGEIAVGEPWETRVPTALVLARTDAGLPKWKRKAPDEWAWEPETAS